MAIRKNHIHDEILYPSAYIRIEKFEFGKKENYQIDTYCWAAIYKEKSSSDGSPICSTNIYFSYNLLSVDNLLQQAYQAMKSMPEWSDSIDDI